MSSVYKRMNTMKWRTKKQTNTSEQVKSIQTVISCVPDQHTHTKYHLPNEHGKQTSRVRTGEFVFDQYWNSLPAFRSITSRSLGLFTLLATHSNHSTIHNTSWYPQYHPQHQLISIVPSTVPSTTPADIHNTVQYYPQYHQQHCRKFFLQHK